MDNRLVVSERVVKISQIIASIIGKSTEWGRCNYAVLEDVEGDAELTLQYCVKSYCITFDNNCLIHSQFYYWKKQEINQIWGSCYFVSIFY